MEKKGEERKKRVRENEREKGRKRREEVGSHG